MLLVLICFDNFIAALFCRFAFALDRVIFRQIGEVFFLKMLPKSGKVGNGIIRKEMLPTCGQRF